MTTKLKPKKTSLKIKRGNLEFACEGDSDFVTAKYAEFQRETTERQENDEEFIHKDTVGRVTADFSNAARSSAQFMFENQLPILFKA
ncbi:MAG: hypothetical protein ACREDS_07430, partial [Limisphaerales bacterium]